jgi:hypothetical protein
MNIQTHLRIIEFLLLAFVIDPAGEMPILAKTITIIIFYGIGCFLMFLLHTFFQ